MDAEKIERKLAAQDRQRTHERKQGKRRQERMQPVDALSWRNKKCYRRARDINAIGSHSHTPVVILGQAKSRPGYAAAQINVSTGMDQYSNNNQNAIINFYFLSEQDAREIQENPLVEDRWSLADDRQSIGQEKARTLSNRGGGYRDGLKQEAGEWTSGRVFNPIGAIHRRIQIRKAAASLEAFEESLDGIEAAMTDPSLNPGLVELASQRAEALQSAEA